MSIDEYRLKIKDNYIASDVVCPHCGKTFQKRGMYHCPKCLVKIFDKDENGWVVLIDPNTSDKSRRYKVVGLSESEPEHYPGELVSVTVPFLTDSRFNLTADGIELFFENNDDKLTARFLMPPHDVRLEKSFTSDMMKR